MTKFIVEEKRKSPFFLVVPWGVKESGADEIELTSSTLAEADELEWSSSTSYVVDNKVMVAAEHKIFICRVNNTNKSPLVAENIYDADAETGYWTLYSSTNKWKMFDDKVKSKSYSTDPIIMTFTAKRNYDSLSFLEIYANLLNVIITNNNGDIVFSTTSNLNDTYGVVGYYDWFFTPPIKKFSVSYNDIKGKTGDTIYIQIDNSVDDIYLGRIVFGLSRFIGVSEQGLQLGFENYSEKTQDYLGHSVISEGIIFDNIDVELKIDGGRENFVKKIFTQNLNKPSLFIADKNLEHTILFGYVKSFALTMLSGHSNLRILLEELS